MNQKYRKTALCGNAVLKPLWICFPIYNFLSLCDLYEFNNKNILSLRRFADLKVLEAVICKRHRL